MVSKNQIKLIQKLQQKKYRLQYQMFIVEGKKSILEFLQSGFEVEQIFITENFAENLPPNRTNIITKNDLQKISWLKNPDEGVAIFKIPLKKKVDYQGIILVLDGVSDPGNLGTIIRLCDWFGIENLVCSPQSVDCFNPKVVQASMGSLSRVSVQYTDLEYFIKSSSLPVFTTATSGENMYITQFPKNFILVMGNEANGISENVLNLATKSVTIPRFGNLQQTESLNVATATAILLSQAKGNSF